MYNENRFQPIDYSRLKLEAMASSLPGGYASLRDGVETYIRNHANSYTKEQAAKVRNAMSTTTGSQGGYSVATLVAAELVNMLKGYGWMRAVASQFHTAKGSDLSIPTSDGTAEIGEVLAQNAAASNLDANFGTAPVNTCRVSSKVFTVPVELLQDSSIDIVSFLMLRMRERIGRKQNALFTTGTGTGEPTGLITAATLGKVGTTGQTLTIVYDDVVDLVESVDDAHLGMPDKTPGAPQPMVGFMCSSAMRKVLRKLKDTAGQPIFKEGRRDSDGTYFAEMLGFPVFPNNDMAAPAANAKTLAFGNFSKYSIRDALDVTLLRMDDSAFALKGQVGFLGAARTGGNLLDVGAVKTYQHSAT